MHSLIENMAALLPPLPSSTIEASDDSGVSNTTVPTRRKRGRFPSSPSSTIATCGRSAGPSATGSMSCRRGISRAPRIVFQ